MRLLVTKKLIITTLFTGFLLAFFAIPTAAQAQAVGRFDCSNPAESIEKGTQKLTSDGIGELTGAWLKNLFSRGSLQFRLRCDPLIIGQTNSEGQRTSTSVYQVSLNLVNFAVLIILVVIAFANILRIKLDTYAVKKAVPLLVFGVIMANVGLPIIRTAVDLSNVLTATFIGQASDIGTRTEFVDKLIKSVYVGGASALGNTLTAVDGGGSTGWGGILTIAGLVGFSWTALGPFAAFFFGGIAFLILIPAIMFLVLGLLFVARIYVLVILASVSPIAFASLGFEPLKGRIWGWWWKHFINWTFMVPATFALFWLGTRFFDAVGGEMDIGTYILTLVILGFAIQIPLKMGGSIMGKWNSALVEPVKKALTSPFRAAQTYVASAGPRDVSRFLSSRGLNIAKPIRAGIATLEETNKRKEGESKSAQQAQLVSSIHLADTAKFWQWGKLREAYVRGQQERYKSIDNRTAVVNHAQDIIRRSGIDPNRTWADMSDKEKADFRAEIAKDLATKNNDRVAATLVANGMLGNRHEVDDDVMQAVMDLEAKQKISIDRILAMYDTAYKQSTGALLSSTKKTDAIMASIERSLNTAANKKDQEKILNDMLTQLKIVTKDFTEMLAIEKDPNYEAWAKTLLLYSQKHGGIKMNIPPQLRQMQDQLGMASPQSVLATQLTAGEQLINKIRTSLGPSANVDWHHLQKLLEEDGADATNLPYLSPEERGALFATHANIDSLKISLNQYLEKQFRQLKQSGQVTQQELDALIKQIPNIVGSNAPGAMPNLLDAAGLGIQDTAKAEAVVGRLKTYQNIVKNILAIENDPSRIIAMQQAQQATQSAAPATTPPTSPASSQIILPPGVSGKRP